jgi:tetratricopeptide (TPR) repeat protein
MSFMFRKICECLIIAVATFAYGQSITVTVPATNEVPNNLPKPDRTTAAFLKRAQAALANGQEALDNNDLGIAETQYSEAVQLSRKLPDPYYVLKDSALHQLSNIYEKLNTPEKTSQPLLEERVAILRPHPKDPGLLLGLALFDLESYYGGTKQIDKALQIANQAVDFYKACEPEVAKTCDRRMADVQGMMGAVFYLNNRNTEATPWLQQVVARDDEGVRPSIMLVSLQAYSKLLFDGGEIWNSAKMAHRAEEFKKKHPEAVTWK